jgi:hypothetical protein
MMLRAKKCLNLHIIHNKIEYKQKNGIKMFPETAPNYSEYLSKGKYDQSDNRLFRAIARLISNFKNERSSLEKGVRQMHVL